MAGELPGGYQQQFNLLMNSVHGGGGVPIGGSALGGQNSQGTSDSYQTSGSYFANPQLAGQVSGALGNTIQQSAQGYNSFVNNPTNHPAYTNALSGMLAALHPGEMEGQRNLADMYRAAGNTASSSYGEAMNKYQQGVDRNRMGVASDLLQKLYPQIAGAMFAPLSQAPELLAANKLDSSVMQSHSQNTSAPAGNDSSNPFSMFSNLGNMFGGGGGTKPFNFNGGPGGTGQGAFPAAYPTPPDYGYKPNSKYGAGF
jgi:hypothetical protein